MQITGLKFVMIHTIILLLLLPAISTAQPDTSAAVKPEIYRIQIQDGSLFIGYIISETDSLIRFETLSGIEVHLPVKTIKKKEIIEGREVEGQYWRPDPNKTRMLFAPTARPLKQGQGYFSVYQIFFPFVAVGVTDFFTLAGGVSLIPGARSQLLYVAPKITPLHLKKFDLAFGLLYLAVPDVNGDGDNSQDLSLVYSVATYGTEKSSLTLGVGYGLTSGELQYKPVFAIGGDVRVSRSTKLLTENWIIPESEVVILSAGIRFFGEKIAADFGLVRPVGPEIDVEGFPFIPWAGFAYNFGHKK